MFDMKMIDGSKADPAYVARVERLVDQSASIESTIPIDELEAYADAQREESDEASEDGDRPAP